MALGHTRAHARLGAGMPVESCMRLQAMPWSSVRRRAACIPIAPCRVVGDVSTQCIAAHCGLWTTNHGRPSACVMASTRHNHRALHTAWNLMRRRQQHDHPVRQHLLLRSRTTVCRKLPHTHGAANHRTTTFDSNNKLWLATHTHRRVACTERLDASCELLATVCRARLVAML